MQLNIIPQILAINTSNNKIKMFSLNCLFCLNRTKNPIPDPANKPDKQLPKVMILSK